MRRACHEKRHESLEEVTPDAILKPGLAPTACTGCLCPGGWDLMDDVPPKLLKLAARSLAHGLIAGTTGLCRLNELPLETAQLVCEEWNNQWAEDSGCGSVLCRQGELLQGFARWVWCVRRVPRTIRVDVLRLRHVGSHLTHLEVAGQHLPSYDSSWLAGLPHLTCLQLVDIPNMISAVLTPLLFGAVPRLHPPCIWCAVNVSWSGNSCAFVRAVGGRGCVRAGRRPLRAISLAGCAAIGDEAATVLAGAHAAYSFCHQQGATCL